MNIFKNKLQVGLEPTTLGLEDPRATDCATEAIKVLHGVEPWSIGSKPIVITVTP